MGKPRVETRTEPYTSRLIAWCNDEGCLWAYSNTVKSDVEQHATWHRQQHRDASKAVGGRG